MGDSTIINDKVMKHYTDRASSKYYREIADKCTRGIIVLYDDFEINISDSTDNLFFTEFIGEDIILKKEYLFAMDYLSNVLTAYRETGRELYKDTFIKIVDQFIFYTQTKTIFLEDLPIFTQILLLIKAKDILGFVPKEEEWMNILEIYSEWLMDDKNYFFDNNHGIFSDLALLHLGVFLMENSKSVSWKERAITRINQLFKIAYYDDFTNNEHSIVYFRHNNIMYKSVIDFCNNYGIKGIENIERGIVKAEEALTTIAHADGTYPIIGDGKVIYGNKSNNKSEIFPNMGLAIIKKNELYFSLKAKTVGQAHAHIDVGSITARYKNIDFILDCGQYNYDRYTPINRYLRSSAGHSGFYPMFADNMFQKEFSKIIENSTIINYDNRGTVDFISNQFNLKDVFIKRKFFISEKDIVIVDSWYTKKPTTMRQRFVLPQYLIKNSKFIASEKRLEVYINKIKIIFKSFVNIASSVTEVNFGVMSAKLNEYETTMLFDTYVENEKKGKIVTKIRIIEEI